MKKFSYLFILITSIILLSSCESNDEKITSLQLTLNISNIQTIEGTLYIDIYNSKDDFMKKAYKRMELPVTDLQMYTTVELKPGNYAVAMFQDLNNNQKMDITQMSIPTEPYGISKHSKGVFQMPSFQECAITMHDNTTCKIVMNTVNY